MKTKLYTYKLMYSAVVMYGQENWVLTERQQKMLQAGECVLLWYVTIYSDSRF